MYQCIQMLIRSNISKIYNWFKTSLLTFLIILISQKIGNQINCATIAFRKLFVYVDVKMISVQKSQFKQQGKGLQQHLSSSINVSISEKRCCSKYFCLLWYTQTCHTEISIQFYFSMCCCSLNKLFEPQK